MNSCNKRTVLPCRGSKEAESNLKVRYGSNIETKNTSFKENYVTKLFIYDLNKLNFVIVMDETFAFIVT
jgi:hypothetical protein